MPNHDRRAAARRKAWGRGPAILRFEPMEGREMLSVASVLSSIAAAASTSTASAATVGSTSTDTTTSIQNAILDSTTASNIAATASANAAGTTDTSATAGATTTAPAATSQSASSFDGSNLIQTAFDSTHNADWGQTIQISGTVQNEGSTANLQAYVVDVYASTAPSINANSTLIAAVPVAAGQAPATSFNFNQTVNAPAVPMADLGTAASYYLVPQLALSDGSAINPSTVIGAPMTSVVTVTPKGLPQLQGAGLSISPGSVSWGGSVTVTASVMNNSSTAAPATNARIILTPTGQTPGAGLDYEIGQVAIPPVGAFQTVNATQTLTLPTYVPSVLASSSSYTVTMVQDANATASPLVTAALSTSPQTSTSLTIAAPAAAATTPAPAPADLVVVDVQEPTPTIYRGGTFTVGATIRNIGTGDAGSFKVRFLLVTDPTSTAPAYVLGDATLPGLAAGMEQSALQVVSLPFTLPAGFAATYPTAQVVAQVDPDNAIDESSTAGKTLAAAAVTFSTLTPTSTTSVPVLPGGTAATTSTGTASNTITTAPVVSPTKASASAFTTTSITGNQIPAANVPTPAATTTSSTTTAAKAKAATVHTQVVAKLAAAKAKAKAQAAARAEALALAKAKAKAARQHALKLYHPAAKLAKKG